MIKPLAIYLPQFHPIAENDEAWGEGFTEWTNVKKAQPLFEGHYQPHIPHESVGYYDLRDPEVLVKQAAMAKEYGIYGFAFYHYWFNGKRLLNTPVDNMLKHKKPNFPFCLIWANENWTKKWDGWDQEIIIKQDYSFEDDKLHMEFLCTNFFNDNRYIRINNKPVFIVYRTELFPDIAATTKIWRKTAKEYGFDGLYLVRVESFSRDIDPETIGFDAAMEFAPNWNKSNQCIDSKINHCNDYPGTVFNMILKTFDYKIFRSVFPSWDNTARRNAEGVVYLNNTLEVFKYYFQRMVEYTHYKPNDEKYIFINAWNEWAEGCHIEPDKKNGFKYLEVIKDVLDNPLQNYEYQTMVGQQKLIRDLKNSNSYKLGNLLLWPFSFFKKMLKA